MTKNNGEKKLFGAIGKWIIGGLLVIVGGLLTMAMNNVTDRLDSLGRGYIQLDEKIDTLNVKDERMQGQVLRVLDKIDGIKEDIKGLRR